MALPCRPLHQRSWQWRPAQSDNDNAFVLTVPGENLCKQAFLTAACVLAAARLLRISCVCVCVCACVRACVRVWHYPPPPPFASATAFRRFSDRGIWRFHFLVVPEGHVFSMI